MTAGLVAAMAILVPLGALSDGLSISGIAPGTPVMPKQVGTLLRVAVPSSANLADFQVSVDGRPVKVRRSGDYLVLDAPDLHDGTHTVTARHSRRLLPDTEVSNAVTVDGTPPDLTVDDTPVTDLRGRFTLRGHAGGATAVTVDHRPAHLAADGTFTVSMAKVPTDVLVVARDAAGNYSARDHTVTSQHPAMRAVHMTAMAWSSATLREPVLRMAAEGRVNTVELDIKDESGEVGYQSQVPLAREIGATRGYYDAKAVVDQLHAAGIRVVGRLVAFRDPILAQASWGSGRTDRVLQTSGGQPWAGSYGRYAFTNFANPEVVDYNVALAEEASRLGFDDILYDYVRRPEGKLADMRIVGLKGTPEQAIADFLARSRTVVRVHGAFLGASVFGIAADRPTAVAQDIPAIAERVDYISPMVYPSHWGPGEYNVAQPDSQPYDIVYRSLSAFEADVKDRGAQIIPWLQAFSLGHGYGPAEVQAQIKAASDAGATSFLLWDPSCRYAPAAPPLP